jgi:hypothetical protein
MRGAMRFIKASNNNRLRAAVATGCRVQPPRPLVEPPAAAVISRMPRPEKIPMTDNVAILRGFTRYVLADSDQVSLHLLIKPDTDLDSTFRAYDTDEQIA